MEEQELRRGLGQLDGAIFFILLLVGSILFSYCSMLIQRRQLLAALRGESLEGGPSPLPPKRAASAISIGALGFYLWLSLDALGRAGEGIARRAAQTNVLASTLVLGAALLRFYNLLLEESDALSELETAELDDLPPV